LTYWTYSIIILFRERITKTTREEAASSDSTKRSRADAAETETQRVEMRKAIS
jgi:hypothetical protein